MVDSTPGRIIAHILLTSPRSNRICAWQYQLCAGWQNMRRMMRVDGGRPTTGHAAMDTHPVKRLQANYEASVRSRCVCGAASGAGTPLAAALASTARGRATTSRTRGGGVGIRLRAESLATMKSAMRGTISARNREPLNTP